MKWIKILPFVFLFSDACIERFDVPDQLFLPSMVVDGLLTDQPGPYTIKLYTAVGASSKVTSPPVVSKASVTIVDDAGVEEKLSESVPGTYQTKLNGIQGTLGHTYYIKILIGDKEYRSVPQTLTSAGNIADLYYTFQKNVLNSDNSLLPQDVLNIYTDAEGSEGTANLFRWRWSSIYEIRTLPQLRTKLVGKSLVPKPDPVPCSGYIVNSVTGGIEYKQPCTCCFCWANEAGKKVIISNNQLVSNYQFKGVNVASLPVDKWRFNIKYYIKVEQLSLSEEVFAFWKLFKAQQDGEGSLFQPNAVRIKGNIFSVTDPDEEVLGIFGVSGVVSKEIFILPKDIPKLLEMDSVKESCTNTLLHATLVKPPFW
jgi:hypothetical protein